MSLWPKTRYFQYYRAASFRPGITLTVLTTVVGTTLATTKWYAVNVLQAGDALQFLVVSTLAVLGAVVVSVWIGGYATLASLAPIDYSRIIISGRPPSEIFVCVSKEIEALCCGFLEMMSGRDERQLKELEISAQNGLEAVTEDNQKAVVAIIDDIKNADWTAIHKLENRVRRKLQKQFRVLQRVEAMKRQAADDLGIPARRLCDHVFWFSPALYRNRVNKFWHNLEELRLTRKAVTPESEIRPVCRLITQNCNLIGEIKKRRVWQRTLQRHSHSHEAIFDFASSNSTSAALKAYARAITDISRRQKKADLAADHLKLLWRTQQAHPGYHLHALLVSLVEHLSDSANKLVALEVLRNSDSPDEDQVLEGLKAVSALEPEMTQAIVTNRQSVSQRFVSHVTTWLNDKTIIVVHGYSKTIRETLRQYSSQRDVAGTNPKLFFLVNSPDDRTDARLLVFELRLRERKEVTDTDNRAFSEIVIGDWSLLVRFCQRDNRVIILLGAEAFDEKRRVLHPHGMLDLRKWLKRLSRRVIESRVLVVAEQYKSVGTDLLGKTAYFANNFDPVPMYESDCIDAIISDEKTYPSNWII